MSSVEGLFTKNIVLDQGKFHKAASDFAVLSRQMEQLQKDISTLLVELTRGFDTPAGRRFMDSCQKNLLDQLKDQADVMKHVSDNLKTACSEYESVFTEFGALNRIIDSVN